VFDGGLRRAQVAQARAEFDASAANYRGTVVIGAFQQVEDSLATPQSLSRRRRARRRPRSTPRSARWTFRWRSTQGATDYLTVVTSQTALLQTQLQALNLDTLQLRASVDLIRALGGGWPIRSSSAPLTRRPALASAA
jgi:outer membrane protein TolC